MSTILIVDDESSIRFLVRITLENAGYSVAEAHHGAAALELVAEARPDVVVTDLMMPVMGGRALIERLRADPLTAAIPIIVLSANANLEADQADIALGKPFQPDELVDSVQTLIDKGETR